MIGLVAGWLLGLRLWPERIGLQAAITTGALAVGVATLPFYAWLLAGSPTRWALAGAELALLGVALALPRRPRAPRPPAPEGRVPVVLVALLAAAALSCVVALVRLTAEAPHGLWDAVEIWNYRARMFVRADSLWDAFRVDRHADYPLLVPLAVGELWLWWGETIWTPALLGALFGAGTVGLLFAVARERRGPRDAALLTTVLLAVPFFGSNFASQRADIPLALFMLATLALLVRHDRQPDRRWLWLAGATLGCALWTKNEGLLFVVALAAARLATGGRRALPELGWMAAAAAPFAVALAVHKVTCGDVTDLLAGPPGGPESGGLDPSRLGPIADALGRHGFVYLLGFFLLRVELRRGGRLTAAPGVRFVGWTLAIVLAGYLAVFVVTPHDVEWHLSAALDRLLLQLWPSALLWRALWSRPATSGDYST